MGLHAKTHVYVCLFVAVYCKFEMSAFKYFTKLERHPHVLSSEDYTARVQHWLPEAKMTEVEASMATYLWFVQLRQAAYNAASY